MVTCQSSELGWEVTVELPTDFLSLGRGSVRGGGGAVVNPVDPTSLPHGTANRLILWGSLYLV